MKLRESAGISTGTSAENLLWNGGFFVLKEFKNIDSQLNVLKERGLTIGDYNSAKRYLLTNNYYNIINGYSKYFLENHKYVNNSTFEEITDYTFLIRR
jgi:abortive infection bacteriophage resistance protein